MGEEEKVGGYVSVVFGHPMVRNTQIERDSSDMNVSGEYSILMLVHGSHMSIRRRGRKENIILIHFLC